MSVNTKTMVPADLPTAYDIARAANIPVLVHSSPGIGKSTITRDYAAKHGLEFYDWRLSQMDPVDLRGVPYVDKTGDVPLTRWALPEFVPRGENTRGILGLEEIGHAHEDMQAASFEVILDRRVAGVPLPDGVIPIALTNKDTDFTIANELASALKNRFMHIVLRTDFPSWLTYATLQKFHPAVTGFVKSMPAMLNEFSMIEEMAADDSARDELMNELPKSNGIATQRSWEGVSKLLQSIRSKEQADLLPALVDGLVGPRAGIQFNAYMNIYRHMPDVDKALANPATVNLSSLDDHPSLMYAFSSAIASRMDPDKKDVITAAFKLFDRIPPEYSMQSVQALLKVRPEFSVNPTYTAWVANNTGAFAA